MRVGNVMDKHLGRRLCINDLRNMFTAQKGLSPVVAKSMMRAL
jgi:hypothetical protein